MVSATPIDPNALRSLVGGDGSLPAQAADEAARSGQAAAQEVSQTAADAVARIAQKIPRGYEPRENLMTVFVGGK